ncbi:MAG: rRNA pseudouridine synthase [Fimbriimonadaceae bacterium]|nr:rRNA pseudouridine synthase [Fimbriimonadaceae bacterium]
MRKVSNSAKNLLKEVQKSSHGQIGRTDGMERLHKRIAHAGLCSRRTAEKWIVDGRVMVNGAVVTELGVSVAPGDEIKVDGKSIAAQRLAYIAMHKPAGYVTTMSDPQHRKTVADLMPEMDVLVKPVGRLDMETEGLLVFTNDGPLAQRLTHPSFGIEKEYIVTVSGMPDDKALERIEKGMRIDGVKTAPARVSQVYPDTKRGQTTFTLVIHEGRNRQVRKMCDAIGTPVVRLRRVRLGPVSLGKLPKGACRVLAKTEVDALKKLAGIPL